MKGKCIALPNSTTKIKKTYGAGREKRFNFKSIGDDTVPIYNKGQQFITTKEEFFNNFKIYTDKKLGGDNNGIKYNSKCSNKT